MTKPIKTKLQLFLGAILVVTFAVAGCDNKESKTKTTTDTVITDSTMDSGKTKPVTETKPK